MPDLQLINTTEQEINLVIDKTEVATPNFLLINAYAKLILNQGGFILLNV